MSCLLVKFMLLPFFSHHYMFVFYNYLKPGVQQWGEVFYRTYLYQNYMAIGESDYPFSRKSIIILSSPTVLEETLIADKLQWYRTYSQLYPCIS